MQDTCNIRAGQRRFERIEALARTVATAPPKVAGTDVATLQQDNL
jgi:hypothetical protein